MMALTNSNRNRNSCYVCFKVARWIPVLFIVSIIVWSYYAYVVQLCFVNIESTAIQVIYTIFYHIFFVMLCWSYWQTIFTDIGRVPSKYKISDEDFRSLTTLDNADNYNEVLDNILRNLQTTNVNILGAPRFCDKCRILKPDRTHHCSVCGECVLKMDHHCPWINNCVSFTNYKFFILFLGYALTYCIYVSLTSLPYFLSFCRGDLKGVARFHILFLFLVAVMFGVSLISLFCYHCYLVCQNRTTLEAFRPPIFRTGPDKHGFSLGHCNNFKEVFGTNPVLWFIPLSTSLGNGTDFPANPRHQVSTYRSMDYMRN